MDNSQSAVSNGNALAEEAGKKTERSPASAVAPMKLVIHPGGTAFDVTQPQLLVGRHADAGLRLVQPDVSRRHCRFIYLDNRWEVFDLNSLNGLYVNEERVEQAVLQHGDLVTIGSFTLQVDLGLGLADLPPRSPARILTSIVNVLKAHAPAADKPQRKAS